MPKKNNDPYAGILGIMSNVGGNAGKQAMPGIGTIVSPPPNLVVSFNGMELNSNFCGLMNIGCKVIIENLKDILFQKHNQEQVVVVMQSFLAIHMKFIMITQRLES